MLFGYLSKLLRRPVDICLVPAQDLLGLLFAPSDIGLPNQLVPSRPLFCHDRTSFQLDGRRLPACLTRMWLARTCPEPPPSMTPLSRWAPGSCLISFSERSLGLSQDETLVSLL
jgi:hypothetical protein